MNSLNKWFHCYVLPFLLLLVPTILLHLYTYFPSQVPAMSPEPCEYRDGEWVPDESGLGLLYNGTCETISEHENCESSGRPDSNYLRWKWKPKQCRLPYFDPETFLNLVRNKNIAFVGDSLARNQMESLICMLQVSEKPNLFHATGKDRKWNFTSHHVIFSLYWSPFLVKGIEKTVHAGEANYNTMFLDTIDQKWAVDLMEIDILVMNIGHWFIQPTVYKYSNNSILGCHLSSCTEIGFHDPFKMALNTTFKEIIKARQTGKDLRVLFNTFLPAHFEGDWRKVEACSRTQPYKKNEMILKGLNAEMRNIVMEQVKEGDMKSGSKVSIEGVDVTEIFFARPDGHPGAYMNPFPFAKGIPDIVLNDCLHWCLPGPIDTLNQIMLDIIKRGQIRDYFADIPTVK